MALNSIPMTVGRIVGPAAGAYLAAHFGADHIGVEIEGDGVGEGQLDLVALPFHLNLGAGGRLPQFAFLLVHVGADAAARDGASVIMVTHSHLAAEAADRVISLEEVAHAGVA